MEESRKLYYRRKPRVILDKRFPFTKDLEFGESGQLEVTLEATSEHLEMDDQGNDIKAVGFKILEASIFDPKQLRRV